MSKNVEDLASEVRARAGDAPVEIGLILGSGLGHLSQLVDGVRIPYNELDGFPHAGVSGHVPELVIGDLEGRRVAVLGGRSHYYESGRADAMRRPLELLWALGTTRLLATNAAGSCDPDMGPGELMLLSDHINLAGTSPLIGEPTDARFVPLTDAHDARMAETLRRAADACDVELNSGVYAWFSGPNFETPAEIRMARILGVDAAGMSTVPEVILARFFGMRIAAISVITNMGAGMSDEKISHEHTKAMAPIGAAKLEKVIREALRSGL